MMLQINKKFIPMCAGRAKLLKRIIVNCVTESNHIRCLSCAPQTWTKNNNVISTLFTPVPFKSDEEVSNAGVEFVGKLNKDKIVKVLNAFYRKPELKNLAKENGLDSHLLQTGFISFRKYCLGPNNLSPDLHIKLFDIINSSANVLDLFPYFYGHLREIFPHLDCMEDLKKIGDLRTPPNWYPEARKITRKIVFHSGPTNSGKTYHAIKKFLKAKTGVYCGPLKLLAVEIFNKANDNGVQCDLVTGEEIIYARPDGDHSDHVSCTVEMCSLENTYDVAVIDEIQMIRDIQRGWAWTRALLGLKAKEIHLCGEESAIDLVDSILCTTNEDLEINNYQRLTQLEIDTPIESMENVTDGDCVVCFSKKDIFSVTESLERLGKEVAVIYGTLPPGTKLAQCKKFNDPNNPCKILVATDAIGMGLNLAIRRIIFYSLMKPTINEKGEFEVTPIPVSQALQIAGRAGRFNTQYPKGYVTTFKKKDIDLLHELLSKKPESATGAGLLPTVDQIELYSYYLPNSSLSNLLEIFVNLSTVDDSMYFMCDMRDFRYLAEMIEHVPLPLRVKYIFCSAPINKKFQFPCSIFLKFAKMYSENTVITFSWLCKAINWPVSHPKSVRELIHLESIHDSLDLYLWLCNRFPDYFPHGESVKGIQKELDLMIQQGMISIIKLLKNWEKHILDISGNENEDKPERLKPTKRNLKFMEHTIEEVESSNESEPSIHRKNDSIPPQN